jgi:hypothetical protein
MNEARYGGLIDKWWIITYIVVPIIIVLLVILCLNIIGYFWYHNDYPNAVNTSISKSDNEPKILCTNYTIKDNYYYCSIDDVIIIPNK